MLDSKEYITYFRQHGFLFLLYYLFLCISVLVLPFHKTFAFFPMTLAGMVAVFILIFKFPKTIFLKKEIFYSAACYLIFCFAYFISHDKHAASVDLQSKAALFIVPLLIAAVGRLDKKRLNVFLSLFIFSCFAFSFTAIVIACYKLVYLHDSDFYYKALVEFTNMHPSYVGMYISFCVACLLYTIIRKEHSLNRKQIFLRLICIAWLIFFLLLLTAKIAIISSLIMLNGAMLYWGKKNKKLKQTIFVIFSLAIIGSLIIFILPVTKERMQLLTSYNDTSSANSVNSRYQIWSSILNHTEMFWLKGVGNGDDMHTLMKFYQDDNFQKGIDENYNAHNQFLQVWLMSGIAGLFFFVLIYYLLISFAIKSKDLLYLLFVLLFIANSMTESTLETQSGTLFFALFNVFLILRIYSKPLLNKA